MRKIMIVLLLMFSLVSLAPPVWAQGPVPTPTLSPQQIEANRLAQEAAAAKARADAAAQAKAAADAAVLQAQAAAATAQQAADEAKLKAQALQSQEAYAKASDAAVAAQQASDAAGQAQAKADEQGKLLQEATQQYLGALQRIQELEASNTGLETQNTGLATQLKAQTAVVATQAGQLDQQRREHATIVVAMSLIALVSATLGLLLVIRYRRLSEAIEKVSTPTPAASVPPSGVTIDQGPQPDHDIQSIQSPVLGGLLERLFESQS